MTFTDIRNAGLLLLALSLIGYVVAMRISRPGVSSRFVSFEDSFATLGPVARFVLRASCVFAAVAGVLLALWLVPWVEMAMMALMGPSEIGFAGTRPVMA